MVVQLSFFHLNVKLVSCEMILFIVPSVTCKWLWVCFPQLELIVGCEVVVVGWYVRVLQQLNFDAFSQHQGCLVGDHWHIGACRSCYKATQFVTLLYLNEFVKVLHVFCITCCLDCVSLVCGCMKSLLLVLSNRH